MLYIHKKFNLFFDKLEIDGTTSYLTLLLYFILDYQLCRIVVEIDKETSSSTEKKYCLNIHNIIREKLWPYCGSLLAVTAAFLTGNDITTKIEAWSSQLLHKRKGT